MATPKYFLVAGATGRQGGAIIDALLDTADPPIKPQHVWAITRDAKGRAAQQLAAKWPSIKLITGDLKDSEAILQQLDSDKIEQMGIFLAQAYGPSEVPDATGFIDAALRHGVPYFVYSSVDRGGRELSDTDPSYCKTFSDKYRIEKHLKAATAVSSTRSMDYTILRPTWFADNAQWGFPGQLCMTGWRDWMGGKRMQVVTTKDIGRWAAEALVRPDRTGIRNQALSIASDELSFDDFDALFKRKTGKDIPVTYRWPAYLMIWLIKDLNTMFSFIHERDYGADLPWLREKLAPTTVEQWVGGLR